MSDCWQKRKIIESFSSSSALLKEVSKGLVIRSILFDIYLTDIFFFSRLQYP